MAAYPQQGKRQKVREGRSDNVDYFQGIDKVEYNNSAAATDSLSYRYYNAGERVHSRPMEDWMRCSVSFTEFKALGHGHDHKTHSWNDSTRTLDNYKRCIKALYEFCSKLGVKYWTAFDTDLVPLSDSWEENKASWEEVVEYVQELGQRYHVKVLWIAPDLHSHPRYTSGAMTSNDATTFVHAASQIKKCLEVSQKLNAECFQICPYREGYDAIFQTDLNREMKLFAKLLKITAEYKDRLNYRCQLLIKPYNNNSCNRSTNGFYNGTFCLDNEMVNAYVWDVTSCLYFLKSYNLDRYYKVCTPPGHHMYMANVYNMLGGITMSNNDSQYDSKMLTLMMKYLIDQGTVPAGGINLMLSLRGDRDAREMVAAYARYVDGVARALRVATTIVAEQLISKHLQQRYATYHSGLGSRIANNDVTLEECEEHHKKNQPHSEVVSKTEHYETVFQRYIDACDHV